MKRGVSFVTDRKPSGSLPLAGATGSPNPLVRARSLSRRQPSVVGGRQLSVNSSHEGSSSAGTGRVSSRVFSTSMREGTRTRGARFVNGVFNPALWDLQGPELGCEAMGPEMRERYFFGNLKAAGEEMRARVDINGYLEKARGAGGGASGAVSKGEVRRLAERLAYGDLPLEGEVDEYEAVELPMVSPSCPDEFRAACVAVGGAGADGHPGMSMELFTTIKVLDSSPETRVLMVEHKRTLTQAVVKVYHKENMGANSEYAIRRMIKLHAALDHRSITPLWMAWEDVECIYTCCEYISGGSLRDVLHTYGGRLAEDHVRDRVMAPLLQAAFLLHEGGYLHRDLKPDNILLNCAGEVMITDFDFFMNKNVERPNMFNGTLHYMPPEMFDHSLAYDTGVDVWTLACTAYECLTGAAPFKRATEPLTINAIDAGVVTFPADIPLSDEAQDWLLAALIRCPAERPGVLELLRHPWMRQASESFLSLLPSRGPRVNGYQADILVLDAVNAITARAGAAKEGEVAAGRQLLSFLQAAGHLVAGGEDVADRTKVERLMRLCNLGPAERRAAYGEGSGPGPDLASPPAWERDAASSGGVASPARGEASGGSRGASGGLPDARLGRSGPRRSQNGTGVEEPRRRVSFATGAQFDSAAGGAEGQTPAGISGRARSLEGRLLLAELAGDPGRSLRDQLGSVLKKASSTLPTLTRGREQSRPESDARSDARSGPRSGTRSHGSHDEGGGLWDVGTAMGADMARRARGRGGGLAALPLGDLAHERVRPLGTSARVEGDERGSMTVSALVGGRTRSVARSARETTRNHADLFAKRRAPDARAAR